MPQDINSLLQMLQPKRPKPQGFNTDYLADETLDPSIRADAGAGAMIGETRNRAFQAKRTIGMPGGASPNELGALSDLLGSYEQDRASGPLAKQQKEVDALRAGELDAITAGFPGAQAIEQQPSGTVSATSNMSPMQQREIYKRDFAEKNSPSTLQNARIADSQFQQGRQLNASNRTVNAEMAPAMIYAELAQQAAANGGANNIRKLGRNGIEYQPDPKQTPINPNQLLAAMQKERGFLEGAGNTDPFATFGRPDSSTQSFDQSVRNFVINSGVHPDSQAEIFDILSNPQDRSMPYEALAQKYGYDASDPDFMMVRQILTQLRGY